MCFDRSQLVDSKAACPERAKRVESSGEMSEWLKEHAWKACVGETLPWVRIPLSPPAFARRSLRSRLRLGKPAIAYERVPTPAKPASVVRSRHASAASARHHRKRDELRSLGASVDPRTSPGDWRSEESRALHLA